MQTLAHHDAAINGLAARLGHVEKTLGDHGSILHRIENAVTTQSARPQFNFHQTVSTVTTIAVLFSMIVGGIIWITTSQFSGFIAKQEAINDRDKNRLDWQSNELSKITERLGWTTRVEPAKGTTK